MLVFVAYTSYMYRYAVQVFPSGVDREDETYSKVGRV